MRRLLWLMLLATMVPTVALAQTNPCTTPVTTLTYNPTVLWLDMPAADFNAVIPGTSNFMWTELVVGDFLQGVDPKDPKSAPIQTATIQRSAFTPVAGVPDCYQVALPLIGTPTAPHQSAARTRRVSPDVTEGAWSALSNPFVRLGAPPSPRGLRRTP